MQKLDVLWLWVSSFVKHENYDVDATCQSNLQILTMLRKIVGLRWVFILMLLDAEGAINVCTTPRTVSIAQQVRFLVLT